jgi:hypothetical protein
MRAYPLWKQLFTRAPSFSVQLKSFTEDSCSVSVWYSSWGHCPLACSFASLDVSKVVVDLTADLLELVELSLQVHSCVLLLLELLLQTLDLRDACQTGASLAQGTTANLGPY